MSASFGTLSITSQATVVGIPVGIAGASLTLIFTISTGVNKSLLQVTKKTKKEHNKIIALAKSKLSTIDTFLSSALNDSKISHEYILFVILLLKYIIRIIITEKNTYEKLKENIKYIKEENSTAEHSSLKRTTLQKSFKILIIFC